MQPMRLFARVAALTVLLALTFGIVRPAPAERPDFKSSLRARTSTFAQADLSVSSELTRPNTLKATPVPKPKPKPKASASAARATFRSSGRTVASSGRRSSAPSAGMPLSSGSELSKARALLAAQIARHPILRGTTVTFGDARGHQAISYYQSGRIVISTSHTASLERIIAHEVWHIIDWRDNGRIDWGENIPPR